MTFQIHALNPEPFQRFRHMTQRELAQHHASWVVADERPGFPCRVSLADAKVGTRLLLINYEHHPHRSPYRARHAVYIDLDARQATPAPGVVPKSIASRMIASRAFDQNGHLCRAELCPGETLPPVLEALLGEERVRYIHLHNAAPGCFAARVTRSSQNDSEAAPWALS
ncbi:MAG: DUF1203 domain-containing protein [Pseudomonadota bacterium]